MSKQLVWWGEGTECLFPKVNLVGKEVGSLETQLPAACYIAEGTPQDDSQWTERAICQMTRSLIHWRFLVLVCLWLYLWMGELSLMRTSLSQFCPYFFIPAPYFLPYVPTPVCAVLSASSAHALEVKWQWPILLEWVSVFVWQLYVNQPLAEWIFNALTFAYQLLSPDSGLQVTTFAALWFLHWPVGASLFPAYNIITKPSASLSRSPALRRKNYNNNCELLWPLPKERVR